MRNIEGVFKEYFQSDYQCFRIKSAEHVGLPMWKQTWPTCSEVLLSFFLIMMPSQNILKIPVFSFTFSFNAKKASSAIPDDEGISNRFTRGWKNHSPPSFGRLYPTPCRLFNFRGDVPVLLKL